MSEAAAVETHDHGAVQADQLEPSLTPGNLGKLGMWSFLAGDAMTFGAAIAAYGALRIGNPNWPSPAAYLGITTTAIMTFILICSSVTMVEALGSIQTGRMARYRKFMALTVFGGVVYNSVLLIRGMTGKLTPAKANLVEIAGLYWHFVDLVWILIFTFIYLI